MEIEYDQIPIANPNGIQFEQSGTVVFLFLLCFFVFVSVYLFVCLPYNFQGTILVDDLVVAQNSAGFASTIEGRAAEYYVTVSDSNGCTLTRQVNISNPQGIFNFAYLIIIF